MTLRINELSLWFLYCCSIYTVIDFVLPFRAWLPPLLVARPTTISHHALQSKTHRPLFHKTHTAEKTVLGISPVSLSTKQDRAVIIPF